jgi:hypothetical protein
MIMKIDARSMSKAREIQKRMEVDDDDIKRDAGGFDKAEGSF